MNAGIRVACEGCAGTGRRELTPTEYQTLRWVPIHGWASTSSIGASLRGVAKSAINNRLDRLVALGLVEKRPHPTSGRDVQWRRRS